MVKTTTAKDKERPFKPSLIDRFQEWIERLPIRAWIFYVVFGLVMILVQIVFLWLDGGLQAEELLPVAIFNGLLIPFGLGLIHLLDNQAVTSLNSMKPVLDMTESEFDRYEYELSTMRFLPPLIAGLTFVLLLIITELAGIVPIRYAAMDQMPTFAVVYHIFDKLSAFIMGMFFYHTIVQLRLVRTISSSRISVNLSNQGPLQAFSRLTAITAVGLVFGAYGWMLINPDLMASPTSIVGIGVITILAVLVFVWPIFCVHRLMERAKASQLHEIDLRFDSVFSRFDDCFRDEDYSTIERLNGTVASLEIQQRRVKAINTWPWRLDTGGFALSVIALPLIMTVVRFLIEQVLGW